MEKYMYIRISGKNQNEARQLEDIEKNGIPADNVYIDKQSGKDFDRAEYQKMMNVIKEGDVVYFHCIDRLGRNYEQIIEEWNRITKKIKADIVVLDMPLLDTTVKKSDLTGRFIADMVLQVLSYVAEKERENIRQRQAEGIAIAVAQGKFKKKDIDMIHFEELRDDVDNGLLSVKTACEELGITKPTWYALRRKHG